MLFPPGFPGHEAGCECRGSGTRDQADTLLLEDAVQEWEGYEPGSTPTPRTSHPLSMFLSMKWGSEWGGGRFELHLSP